MKTNKVCIDIVKVMRRYKLISIEVVDKHVVFYNLEDKPAFSFEMLEADTNAMELTKTDEFPSMEVSL